MANGSSINIIDAPGLIKIERTSESAFGMEVWCHQVSKFLGKKKNGLDPPYLMELKVEGNFIKFEMDTGSGLTLISEKDFKNSLQHLKLEKASIIVRTYDGTVVPILGKINVKVECKDITYKLRALVVKGEKRALMGREWINRLKLGCFAVKHMPVEITIEEILKENQALFVETTEPIKGFTFSVNMCDVKPIFHKARPVPFAIRPAVTEALDKMVAKGYLCEVASSKWATPVVVVPKKNKEIRICCDFKVTLNKYLDTAAYPLPTQQDLFSTLAKGKYFSKLDLRNAYLQLEVDPGTRPLLTINTHKGLFRFKRMPFGLANAPSYFQSVMDRVLSGIGGVICYIDDVLIATASIEEHLALLKTIFARLEKYNIKLKKEKCLFLQKEIEYLGHLVTEEGIRPLDHKVQAIQKAKTPTNISELRSFLGLVNFYGKFIPNLPELLKPLHELLHKKRPWVWTKECGEAIDKCKNSITSERVLVPYDATLPLCLATEASQIGVGAVLSHIIEGQERPIMFASRTLSVAEQNYSQIEKEALAIIYGVTKFHQFIYGRKFILITDHKPLVTILGSRSGIPTLSTSRLQRWALILSAYTYDIKFRRTQDHGNADLLSRFPVGCEEIPRLNNVYALSYVEELPITAEEIATETEKDEVLSLAKFYTQQGWPEKVADHLRPYFQRKLELTVDGECLVWGMRVVIPPSLRIKMLNCLHETHSGMNKMKAVARSHFWWPNLDTQIEFLVNKCRSCQQSQDGPNKGKWQPWKWSTRPWQRIHIDFANKENINLLIVVDSHSKWIEAIPMRETTTRKTIEQLRRLFSSYGLPEELVSDNGPQFTGSEMKGFLEGNGIKQTLIPAYHPQSNGLAERAVRTIKTALDKNKRKIGDTIQDTLSKVLLAYRSTPHVTTGKTPSELFIGRALRTRVSLIHPSLASRVRDQQARQMKYDRRTHLEEFQIDDLVWCKNFRGGDKWIPGKIVGKKGTRVYTILIHGQVKAYHRDQIRKRWRNGEEDESGDGERQPEHSRGAGPSAIISEVVRDRGYMESLSPGLTSQRSDQDSEVQSDTDDGKSLEPLRSLDPEALKEEGPVLRRNPPRARRPPQSSPCDNTQFYKYDPTALFYVGKAEDPSMYSQVLQKHKELEGKFNLIQNFPLSKEMLENALNIPKEVDNFPDVKPSMTQSNVPQDEPLAGTFITMLAIDASLNPASNIEATVDQLLLMKELQNLSLPDLYCGIIRACFMALVDTGGQDLKWAAFTFLKVPHLILKIHTKVDGKLGSEGCHDVELGIEKFLVHKPLIDLTNMKSNCDSLRYLLVELHKVGVLTEEQEANLIAKSHADIQVIPKLESQSQSSANLILRAEPTVISILKSLESDYMRIQNSLPKILCTMVTGKPLELVLAATAATGKLPHFTNKLIMFNEYNKEPLNEADKDSQTRALLFDITFLMLTHIVQNYGVEVITDNPENKDSFFTQWITECFSRGNKFKCPDTLLSKCSLSMVDQLLQQFTNLDSNFETFAVKWHEVCMNAPMAVKDIVIAWEYGALSTDTVKKILDNIKSRMCCIPVCVSAWLCNYINVLHCEERLKPMNMLQQFMTPLSQEPDQDPQCSLYYKERSTLMADIIRKMMYELHPPVQSKSKALTFVPHSLTVKTPLWDLLGDIFQKSKNRSWIDPEDIYTLNSILDVGGPKQFCQKLVNFALGFEYCSDLHSAVNLALGMMHLDIEQCALSLLLYILPNFLQFESKQDLLVEPKGSALARLTVLATYSALQSMKYPYSTFSGKCFGQKYKDFDINEISDQPERVLRSNKIRRGVNDAELMEDTPYCLQSSGSEDHKRRRQDLSAFTLPSILPRTSGTLRKGKLLPDPSVYASGTGASAGEDVPQAANQPAHPG
ncbi:K02A2.6-like, partial [Cordylochernes scorpioides]